MLTMRDLSWRRTTAILSLAAVAVCTPAAAEAAFTTNTAATVTASTAVITAPDMTTANVHMDCTPSGGTKKMRLVIDQFPTVKGANTYQLEVTDPHGNIIVVDEADALANGFSVPASRTWTYVIRGIYQVPGTANVWTGAASSPQGITC